MTLPAAPRPGRSFDDVGINAESGSVSEAVVIEGESESNAMVIESESESNAVAIELRQVTGYIEPSDLSEVVLELGEGPDVTGSILVLSDSMVHRLQSNNLPADSMRSTLRARLAPLIPNIVCVSCNSPIVPDPSNLRNSMWSLLCNHNLHLHCLQPLGYPIYHRGQSRARTRIRGRQQGQRYNSRPIERFEDAELISSWLCPHPGCSQHHFSFLFCGLWYSNTQGMEFQD